MNSTLLVFFLQQDEHDKQSTKTKVKLYLLADIDMLLIVEKGIRGRTCHAIHHYEKPKNKYMKDYDKNKEPSYPEYCNVNNLYRWAIPQRFPADVFKWVKNTSQFNVDFIKSYNEDNEEYFLKLMFNIRKNHLHNDLPFWLKELKLKKLKGLWSNLLIKKNMSYT